MKKLFALLMFVGTMFASYAAPDHIPLSKMDNYAFVATTNVVDNIQVANLVRIERMIVVPSTQATILEIQKSITPEAIFSGLLREEISEYRWRACDVNLFTNIHNTKLENQVEVKLVTVRYLVPFGRRDS